MKSILDRSFHYTPSAETDLRKTFARIRREQRKQFRTNGTEKQATTETRAKIVPLVVKSMIRQAGGESIPVHLRD